MRVALAATIACATPLAASAQGSEDPVEVSGWMVSDWRDTEGRYGGCTAFFLFDDETAVGFALDKGEKNVFAMQGLKARLTENIVYPVRLKVDDGDTLVTGDVALDNRMLIVPLQNLQKLFQKLRKGGILYVKVNQEAAGSG